MVEVKILGILEEDTVVSFGAIKFGTSTELLTLDGDRFVKGSIYDGVLSKKGLLNYTRNLVRLMMEKTDEYNLGLSALTINLEDMCTNKFILESNMNEQFDSLYLSLSELNIFDSFMSITEESEAFINGVVKDENGEDCAEVEIYITENVAIDLSDPTSEDTSLIDSLMVRFEEENDNLKESEKSTNRVVFNSFAVGLAMQCESVSKDKTEALMLLEESYELSKKVINNG